MWEGVLCGYLREGGDNMKREIVAQGITWARAQEVMRAIHAAGGKFQIHRRMDGNWTVYRFTEKAPAR